MDAYRVDTNVVGLDGIGVENRKLREGRPIAASAFAPIADIAYQVQIWRMSRLYRPRRIDQIHLLIGSVILIASAANFVAHFLFGVTIVDKSTGAPASAVSIIVETAFFVGIGAIFARSGWKLLLAARRSNDR